MAITYPRDLPACLPVQEDTFAPRYQQSFQLTGGGDPNAVDLAPQVWACVYTASVIRRQSIGEVQAWLRTLRGGLKTFKGTVPGRKWPVSYPRGFAGLLVSAVQWGGLGTLSAISAGKDSITVDDVPDGLLLKPGDYVSFTVGSRQHLHMVVEEATAASESIDLTLEPLVSQAAVTGGSVRFEAPYCEMRVEGNVDEVIRRAKNGRFSFTGVQVLI